MTNKKKNKKKCKAKASAPANAPEQKGPTAQQETVEADTNAPIVEVKNEIMLSVHCGTMLAEANKLKQFLLGAGYAVFLCDQMHLGVDYRDEISLHASQCKAFIPFINAPWCKSRECGYEFKIALRKNLVNHGRPALLPLLLEDFKVYDDYPAVYGILCSTNGIRVDPSALGTATWNTILNALLMHDVTPTSRIGSAPLSPPNAASAKELSVSIPSPEPVVIEERTPMRDLTFFPKHVWSDILFYSDLATLGRFAQVATGFYYPSKRFLGGVVTTFAGSGKVGASDGAVQYATFNDICGMAVDRRNGSLYVAEFGNSKIRHISDGSVTTLAGSGATGAQDGPAAAASFKNPKGVAVDQNGNVYVADSWNCKIRKISADGVVSTYAGTGADGCLDGPAGKSMFNCPEGIAVDHEGIVYVADSRSNRIRKITHDGVVSTIAGSGERGAADGTFSEATFSHPVGLAINDNGDIFVADSLNHKIRKISKGVVSTVAGKEKGYKDGTVENANFNKPKGIAIDQTDGSLIVADFDNHRIRKIDQKGRVYTMAGSEKGYEDGNAKKAKFTNPCAIAVHAGVVYIAEEKFVRKLSNAAF